MEAEGDHVMCRLLLHFPGGLEGQELHWRWSRLTMNLCPYRTAGAIISSFTWYNTS